MAFRNIGPHRKASDVTDSKLVRIRLFRMLRFLLRIPAKANANSEGNANGIPGRRRTVSERSDAGNSIVQEVFAFVVSSTVEDRVSYA